MIKDILKFGITINNESLKNINNQNYLVHVFCDVFFGYLIGSSANQALLFIGVSSFDFFVVGSSAARVHISCYDGDIESFTGSDSSLLDDWVFHEFFDFLADASSNKTLLKQLNEDKIVFFFHLLGIDTNGHSHKPWSK